MSRLIALSAAALVVSTCLATAQPGRQVIHQSVTVEYRDLDLRSDRSAQIMLKRIEHAAAEACGGNPNLNDPNAPWTMDAHREYLQCREEAIANAVASLNAPAVARIYAETYGQRSGRLAGR